MKLPHLKLLFTALVTFFLLPACSPNQDLSSSVIDWKPYAEGLQAAGAQGKKAFLYFRADW